MDQLLFHAMSRLWIDNPLRPPPDGADGSGMKPRKAPEVRRRWTPPQGEDRRSKRPICQPVEIHPELVCGQRNSAPVAWSVGPHMQPVTGAADEDFFLVEAEAAPDRRRLIADAEQRQDDVRRDSEEADPGLTCVNRADTQPP